MQYLLDGVLVAAAIGGFIAGITAMAYTLRMYGERKPAPFWLRIAGLSNYMSRYQTPKGIEYRNKSFLAALIFIILCFIGISIGAEIDPEGWERVKDSYRNLPIPHIADGNEKLSD